MQILKTKLLMFLQLFLIRMPWQGQFDNSAYSSNTTEQLILVSAKESKLHPESKHRLFNLRIRFKTEKIIRLLVINHSHLFSSKFLKRVFIYFIFFLQSCRAKIKAWVSDGEERAFIFIDF